VLKKTQQENASYARLEMGVGFWNLEFQMNKSETTGNITETGNCYCLLFIARPVNFTKTIITAKYLVLRNLITGTCIFLASPGNRKLQGINSAKL
jgi:hypothetical protein